MSQRSRAILRRLDRNRAHDLNARAPLFPSNSGIPGLFYPTAAFHDDMGRYYTVGMRAKF